MALRISSLRLGRILLLLLLALPLVAAERKPAWLWTTEERHQIRLMLGKDKRQFDGRMHPEMLYVTDVLETLVNRCFVIFRVNFYRRVVVQRSDLLVRDRDCQ